MSDTDEDSSDSSKWRDTGEVVHPESRLVEMHDDGDTILNVDIRARENRIGEMYVECDHPATENGIIMASTVSRLFRKLALKMDRHER